MRSYDNRKSLISSQVNILGMISKGFQFRRREWLSGRLGQVLYLWIQRDWVWCLVYGRIDDLIEIGILRFQLEFTFRLKFKFLLMFSWSSRWSSLQKFDRLNLKVVFLSWMHWILWSCLLRLITWIYSYSWLSRLQWQETDALRWSEFKTLGLKKVEFREWWS